MGASVVQVLALDVDAGASKMTGQVLREGKRGRPARVGAHQLLVLRPKARIAARPVKGEVHRLEGGVEDFGHVGAAEALKIAAFGADRLSHDGSLLRLSAKRRTRP